MFDSTFMQLGILIGSAFATNPDLRLVIGTLISSNVALGISTGTSVYESETLERERRVAELEKALFRNLDNTMITEKYHTNFKTLKTPKTYVVEIWRKDMLIGSFEFKTVK